MSGTDRRAHFLVAATLLHEKRRITRVIERAASQIEAPHVAGAMEDRRAP